MSGEGTATGEDRLDVSRPVLVGVSEGRVPDALVPGGDDVAVVPVHSLDPGPESVG